VNMNDVPLLCALALAVSGAAGCSSTLPERLGPPSQLDASFLAGGEGARSSGWRGRDAERRFVREPSPPPSSGYDAEEHFVRGRRAPERCFPRPAHAPVVPSSPSPGALLDERPTLRAGGRLACLEVRGLREYVALPSWGDAEASREPAPWVTRPAPEATLAVLRQGLARDRAPRSGWPAPAPFASLVSVPSLLLPARGDLYGARQAGARVGAEAVLVLARSTRVYRYHNGLANLYPLLIGLALPAREEVAVTRVEAALVGVRTGHVFAVAAGEARREEQGFLLTRDREDSRRMAEEAEERATHSLARHLERELRALSLEGRLLAAKR